MSTQVLILAPPHAAGLSGLTGRVGELELRTVATDSAVAGDPPPDVTILLGGARAPDLGGVVVEWPGTPWPAADDLLAVADPAGPCVALVVADEARRGDLAGNLAQRGVSVLARERLTREDLLAAACVVLAGAPAGTLPPEAMAVLAAGRVLVVPECTPAFGLLAGVDHLSVADDGEAADHADAVITHPGAFRLVRAMGRLAARAHRAGAVYPRLVRNLELAGLIPPSGATGEPGS